MKCFRLLIVTAPFLILSLVAEPANAQITPQFSATRTTGVAPLGVFFDATSTTHSDASLDEFNDLTYSWNFGDDPTTAWTISGRSANRADGPVAAHLFENPGIYTVTLVVRDGMGGQVSTSATVNVLDAGSSFSGSATRCFSTSGSFSGCPTGAQQITTTNFSSAVNTHKGRDRRLLFRRGETFSAGNGIAISDLGPGLIGAFGSGSAPRVNVSGGMTLFSFGNQSAPAGCADWRIQDLQFLRVGSASNSFLIGQQGTCNNLTFNRLTASGFVSAMDFGGSILSWWNRNGFPGHTAPSGVFVVGTRFSDHATPAEGGSDNHAISWNVQRSAILGSDISQQFHVIRSGFCQKCVISDSRVAGPTARTGQILKFHGPGDGGPGSIGFGEYSEDVILSANRFENFNGDWMTGFGPQNSTTDERVRRVIIEANHFTANTNTQALVLLWASHSAVRNNLFLLSSPLGSTAVRVTRRGIEPAPRLNRIDNNTCYSSTSSPSTCVEISAAGVDARVRNNLLYAPVASSRAVVSGTGGGAPVVAGNLIASANPFLSDSPQTPGDFALASGTAAAGGGVPVLSLLRDFFGGERSSPWSVGFHEFGSTGAPVSMPPPPPILLAP